MLSKGKNKDYHLVVAGIMSLVAKLIFHNQIDSSTYLFRESYRLQTIEGPDHVWRSIVNSNPIYNDEEFLCVLCATQSMFLRIVDLVKDNPLLKEKNLRKQSQYFSAELHVLVMLKWFGAEGNQSPPKQLRDNLGMLKGTVSNYVNCADDALLSLKDQTFFWPSPDERNKISRRIKGEYLLKNCVGIVDGTHLLLANKPENCGEEYFTRKGQYVISAVVVVDCWKCIHYASVHWLGSVHDNCIWPNCKMVSNLVDFFENNEYLIGDSAFNNYGDFIKTLWDRHLFQLVSIGIMTC
jgi:hypothetical protein